MCNQSAANAWVSLESRLDRFLSSNPKARTISQEVSNELFKDGCQSAVVHRLKFVERLFELLEEAEAEVRYLESYSKSSW